MTLKKIKLGELLEPISERNNDLIYSLENLKGISVNKEFIETKANMEGVSLKPYQLVKPDEFAYVTVTSRNSEKITIAYNDSENVYIVSSSYNVFRVKRHDLLNSKFLFMYFNRPEFDRYSRYNSWGSAREVFTWQEMCDIELELPDLLTQEKFVKMYVALVENQKSYEQGLEDLKLVCDAYIENTRKELDSVSIMNYIERVRELNSNLIQNVKGVSAGKGFIETIANLKSVDLSKYQIVKNNQFAFTPTRINIGSIALYKGSPCVISPFYVVFQITKPEILIPEYLDMWLQRSEFHRFTLFKSDASIRQTFEFHQLEDVYIPIPTIKVQESIVNIYNCYRERKEINDKLKKRIKNICPILIKGSIEEAR